MTPAVERLGLASHESDRHVTVTGLAPLRGSRTTEPQAAASDGPAWWCEDPLQPVRHESWAVRLGLLSWPLILLRDTHIIGVGPVV